MKLTYAIIKGWNPCYDPIRHIPWAAVDAAARAASRAEQVKQLIEMLNYETYNF